MRTLTPTLLAAQRTLGGVPSLLARVEDRERRWAPLLDADTSSRPTAACATTSGIVRARISAAGSVDVQRITSPGTTSQWQAWSTLVAGACPDSAVALAGVTGTDRVRLFFTRPSGAAYAVAWVQSEDGGASWTAPADAVPGLTDASACLAATNGHFLYHDPADGFLKLAERSGWDAGAWVAYPWSAAGALPARHGIAACYRGDTYYVVSSDEGSDGGCRLCTGTCTPSGAGWTAPVPIVPPGLPAAGFRPSDPSLVYTGSEWHLAYLETVTGPLSQTRPLVIRSPDWDLWSYACWVPLQWYGEARGAALVRHGQALYLALEDAVWSAADYASGSGMCLETADLLGYTVEEEAGHGRTVVEVHNPDGRYDQLGEAGSPATPVRPLARLVLERGFRTTAGAEQVARAPYYVVGASLRCGGARPSLRLECEDGWGLLRRWRPDALYAWAGRTLAWLIAHVLYRAASVTCTFDGDPAWSAMLESFAIAPAGWAGSPPAEVTLRSSGLGIIEALLAKAAGAARWQADGSLYCFVPWSQALNEAYDVGTGGEVLDALYGRAWAIPNEVQVFGEGVAAAAGGLDPASSPRRYLATRVDPHLTTAAECAGAASGLVHDAQTRRYTGWVETPCQCGLELYDLIRIDDPRAGSLQGAILRATAISERYDREKGIYTTRVVYRSP